MAYALVQSRSLQGNSVTSLGLAFTSNVVAGNILIAASGNNNAFAAHTVSDSQGNTWQQDADNNTGVAAVNSYIQVQSAKAASSAADTVTVDSTANGGNFPVLAIHEYSGLAATGWKDQSVTARGTGTSHATGSTGTTTTANELVFTADSHIGSTATPTVSGYTIREQQTSGSLVPIATADKRVTATGTQSATWTWANASWSAAVVTYAETAPPQLARPIADTTLGAWTDQAGGTTSVFGTLDETTASDTDYTQSELTPSGSSVRFRLTSLTDPVSSSGHILRYRVGKDQTGGNTMDLTIKLQQGPGPSYTDIKTISRTNVDALTTYTDTLTGTEADLISDYSQLYLLITATAS